jgi:hypothetical protein
MPKRSDISDIQVLQAYQKYKAGDNRWPYEILAQELNIAEKVCYKACERAEGRELLHYGTSVITQKGLDLLTKTTQ